MSTWPAEAVRAEPEELAPELEGLVCAEPEGLTAVSEPACWSVPGLEVELTAPPPSPALAVSVAIGLGFRSFTGSPQADTVTV